MIFELDFDGQTKVDRAIKMLRTFEPPEGYYLAFSGGKDSVVLKALADMAGVKYDAHYTVTSVDPPELVQFVKTFPDVKREIPHDRNGKPVTMWNLIERKKCLPRRLMRFCCAELKETQGHGRFVLTGVRWAESTRRKLTRGLMEYSPRGSGATDRVDPDNPETEKLFQFCPTKAQRRLNPIIDWSDDEVWEFIRHFEIPYCRLYDEGWKRTGCVLCPMANRTQRAKEKETWPKITEAYLRAIKRAMDRGAYPNFNSPEEVMDWWLQG